MVNSVHGKAEELGLRAGEVVVSINWRELCDSAYFKRRMEEVVLVGLNLSSPAKVCLKVVNCLEYKYLGLVIQT